MTAPKPAAPFAPLPFRDEQSGSYSRVVKSADGETLTKPLTGKTAAYIVHAANAYPQLVAALRELIAASDQFVQDTGLKNSDAITDAAESARALLRSLGESA